MNCISSKIDCLSFTFSPCNDKGIVPRGPRIGAVRIELPTQSDAKGHDQEIVPDADRREMKTFL